ncbi:hypothetical protein [Candidatus Chlamydia sanziniae]|uniref:Uncharacterized protein n=1 Tax=Candidatus Chlamydia sanziniae TaxID=1806891 RepID=A0A1A9HW49_9CHLA|nr:hypothetical protein [Candidatus Chlamydia sanziniae]ANH78332.1 hypothetical protein Cs308_0161 [Candidatus Chlamydia sanziniae]
MDNYLTGALIICCVLLSGGMLTIFIMMICFLHHLNKILKNIRRITAILNFEAKIFAPLMLGKKLLCGWLKKKKKNNDLPEEMEEILNEESQSKHWAKALCRGIKWTTAALLIWGMFRNKD